MMSNFKTIIYRIKYRIGKLYDFIKLGWNDDDYSYNSLLTLEKYKLSKMADVHERLIGNIDKEFMESWQIIRDLRLCTKLINIVNDVNIYNMSTKKHEKASLKYVNLRNALRFVPAWQVKMCQKNQRFRLMVLDTIRRKKAWNLYSYIRTKNTTKW